VKGSKAAGRELNEDCLLKRRDNGTSWKKKGTKKEGRGRGGRGY